jgi:acyl dehydratase
VPDRRTELNELPSRTLEITRQRVGEFQTALLLAEPPDGFEPDETSLKVDSRSINALARRSGDTSVWHMEPGAAHRDSSLLAIRMDEAAVDPSARLAHGLAGILLALRTAYQQRRDVPIAGFSHVRFSSPVFEGATLSAQIEPANGTGGFLVTTDQLQPDLAITGRIRYGDVARSHDISFYSVAEQQLYTLEECAGMISALLGLGAEAEGERVLLMSQRLELLETVSIGDTIEGVAEIKDRVSSSQGDRVTVDVGVIRHGDGARLVAWGDATFLLVRHS